MDIDKHIFSISEINSIVSDVLGEAFPSIWLKGEISNLKNYSGHLFFTLKDETGQIRAVLFRGHLQSLKFMPRDGMSVLARGSLGIYRTRGEFQFTAEYLEPLGIGTLKLAYEELKARLEKKGYFDERRKKPIPLLPRRIGVITSPKGSVIRDILHVLKRRYSNIHIILFPVKVQGEGAKEELAEALRIANRDFGGSIDVLILARGGGSIEDLWPFNEEIVADAIYHSKIPVISAIGHETDFTIADFVADLRAPTPSAAAEIVIEKKSDMEEAVSSAFRRLVVQMRHRLADSSQRLAAEARRVRSPLLKITDRSVSVTLIRNRLCLRMNGILSVRRQHTAHCEKRLNILSPRRRLADIRQRISDTFNRCAITAKNRIAGRAENLSGLAARLEALSPLKILGRGYSIAFTMPGNRVLKDSGQVSSGDAVRIKLNKGELFCDITGKKEE